MDWRAEKKIEEDRIKYAQKIIKKLESGDIQNFGLPDFSDPIDPYSYFPCKFVEVVDYEKGVVKIYEPSIKKYHITNAWGLVIS